MPLKPGANPYKILAIEKGCTEKEITKAYRLQCLKWHPDKNLDNKEEAERRFIEAKEAFEFLFDKEKRDEYDKAEERVRIVEERNRERMEKADGNRRKLIEDLNKRENEFSESLKRPATGSVPMTAAQQAKKKRNDENRLREEMENIRKQLEKEANEEVQRQMQRVRQAHESNRQKVADQSVTAKLMVKWKEIAGEDYDENALRIIFEPYGKIANVSSIITKKDRRKCIIEFETGENAWGAETETGMSPQPEIVAEWITPPVLVKKEDGKKNEQQTKDFNQMSLEDLEAQILGGI